MNRILLTCIGTLATLSLTGTAFATPRAVPAATSFTASGPAQLSKTGFPTLNCNLTLSAATGPASVPGTPPGAAGGTISGGTNTGPGNCPLVTVDATTFTILTATATGGTGTINGVTVKLAGTTICATTSPLPFTLTNNGSSPSTIGFNSAIAPDCNVIANLTTNPDINILP